MSSGAAVDIRHVSLLVSNMRGAVFTVWKVFADNARVPS